MVPLLAEILLLFGDDRFAGRLLFALLVSRFLVAFGLLMNGFVGFLLSVNFLRAEKLDLWHGLGFVFGLKKSPSRSALVRDYPSN